MVRKLSIDNDILQRKKITRWHDKTVEKPIFFLQKKTIKRQNDKTINTTTIEGKND